jgi:DNA-binding MarR family transcriptional regulator
MTETNERLDNPWLKNDTPANRFLFEQGTLLRAAKAVFQRRIGVSEARLHVLGMLHRHGEMSQTELQRRLEVDGAVVTRQVKLMETEGLLVRRVDPADNRFTLVTLTPAGRERLTEVGSMAKEFMTAVLEGVSDDDLECMRRTMARMRANLEQL